jgi:hypothetical protein
MLMAFSIKAIRRGSVYILLQIARKQNFEEAQKQI